MLATGLTRLESLFNLFGVILIFLFVLFICYLTTKLVGNSNLLQQKNKNIQVIEIYKIAPNKYIELVKVGEKYLALGVGKEEIEFLSEIPSEQITSPILSSETPSSPELFKDILAKVGKQIKKK